MAKAALDKKQLRSFQTRLQTERREMLDEAKSLEEQRANAEGRPETGGAGSDQVDIATETYEDELAATLSVQAHERLDQIDDALHRIEQGTYGICTDCEQPILVDRLEARPWALRCVTCQAQSEAAARLGNGRLAA